MCRNITANEKVYALLCVGFVRLENSVYTVLPKCVRNLSVGSLFN